MKVDKIYKGIANFINKSDRTQSILRSVSKNPAMFGATSSFLISTTVRPAMTLAVTPDKDDAKFGACSSISAALVELIGSATIFKPMGKAIDKSSQELYKTEGSMFHENPLLLRRYKSVTNRFAKIPPTLLTAMLRFSLIYPITVLLGKAGIVKSSNRGEEKKQDTKGLDVKA